MKIDKTGTVAPVLQLITGLGVGGAERVVLGLVDSLVQQDFPAIVVALNYDNGLLKQYPNVSFPVHQLNVNKWNPFSMGSAFVKLIDIVRKENVSVIHAHMFHALLCAIFLRIIFPKIKVVFTSHNFSGFTLVRRWLIQGTRRLRAVDIVFVTGQHHALNTTDTRVVPNGVLCNESTAQRRLRPADSLVFLSIGRLEAQKNPVGLIDAFASMEQKHCELWLAGDGTLRHDVEQRIAFFDLGERVKMLGVQHDVAYLLQQVDCFVMSSTWEGLPMALLEAGAAALPVVATPVGAIPELLADECGYLADIGNFSKALDAVSVDYNTAHARGMRLKRKIIANYSLENSVNLHKKIYNDISKYA